MGQLVDNMVNDWCNAVPGEFSKWFTAGRFSRACRSRIDGTKKYLKQMMSYLPSVQDRAYPKDWDAESVCQSMKAGLSRLYKFLVQRHKEQRENRKFRKKR